MMIHQEKREEKKKNQVEITQFQFHILHPSRQRSKHELVQYCGMTRHRQIREMSKIEMMKMELKQSQK